MGRPLERPPLQYLFFTRFAARRQGRTGYIRYQKWRLYGEEVLAGEKASVWLLEETLTIAFYDVQIPVSIVGLIEEGW